MNTRTDIISRELIRKISTKLDGDTHINCKLGDQGRLRIDRQLPYICVHRHKVGEPDTEKLLHGQAAYLSTDTQTEIGDLFRTIVQSQSKRFGSFLVIELWQGDAKIPDNGRPPPPGFHIHAPQKNASYEVLDTFGNALKKITLRQHAADVKVSFDNQCAPPDLPPLLNKDEAIQLNCVLLGLEITPVYQDESGSTLPFAFRAIHRSLTRALRKTFYRFSHLQTRYRPRHYHELGPRALTKTVWEVDRRLAQISENFDLLLHVTPVNAARAWAEFEHSQFQETPEFHYRPRSADPALLKRELYQVPLERIGDPTMADLFGAKRDELDRQIALLNDRNSDVFLLGSMQLFGQLDETLLNTAQILISHTADPSVSNDEKLSAQQLAQYARDELEYYRDADSSLEATVEVRDDITGILVSHGNFLIGSDAQVSRARLSATLNHEIGTHALTYHNGKKQPLQLLYAGMAGYEELQEGLAILAEYLSEGLSLPRLQLLAGRVIAVHNICNGADFIECFHSLHDEYGFRPFTAFNMAMRVYRGGGYTKDMIYLRGFIQLLDYLAKEEDMELLYRGKIAMEHLHLLQELRWRGVLKPLALTPRYLQNETSKQRLKALKAEPTIEHILGNL
jgi:uncharacterized protein (TIGR02421 family)